MEDEMTMAEHWGKILEIAETLKGQVAELEEELRDFNKSAF